MPAAIVALADTVMTRVLLEAGAMPLGERSDRDCRAIAPLAGIAVNPSDCCRSTCVTAAIERCRHRHAA